jgi:RecA/RadA recombinase
LIIFLLSVQLGKHLSQLVRLAEEFNVAVLVVNQCMADPGAMAMFVSFVEHKGLHYGYFTSVSTVYAGSCYKASRGSCVGPRQFDSNHAKKGQRRATHRQDIRQVSFILISLHKNYM